MKYFILTFLLFGLNHPAGARGGDHVGNGGDAVVQEFVALGQETVKLLPYLNTSIISEAQKSSLKRAILSAQVESKENLELDSKPVDAINYPQEMRIEVSRSRWQKARPDIRNAHWALTLHEYLWLSGIDDSNYRVSNSLFTDLLAAQTRWRKTPIAQALTQAVCGGIFGRDYVTIENAMQMGADLSMHCEGGDITFQCADGRLQHLAWTSVEAPLERAIGAFGTNYCSEPRNFNPDQDGEMQRILELLLRYRPDLTKTNYGPLKTSSLLEIAASSSHYLPYVVLLKGGADPNLNFDFGGLLRYTWKSLDFFKAAMDAGADINLRHPKYDYVLSTVILQGPESIMRHFVTNHKIDFCLTSKNPLEYPSNQPEVPMIKHAKPEYVKFIQSLGDPCTNL